MRQSIVLPAVGLLWGVAIVVYRFAGSSAPHTHGAYHNGQDGAAVFGALLIATGAIYLVRALRRRR